MAFVGEAASRKSTITSLCQRFYDPTNGQIAYDGTALSQLNVAQYRRLIGSVMRTPSLFTGTIRENLSFGVEESVVLEEELIVACRDAHILDFIQSLP